MKIPTMHRCSKCHRPMIAHVIGEGFFSGSCECGGLIEHVVPKQLLVHALLHCWRALGWDGFPRQVKRTQLFKACSSIITKACWEVDQ